jgi:hypothetical protein
MAQLNTLTEQEIADGWQLLFDGKSTDCWRSFGSEEFPEGWRIDDQALHRADKAGDIITREQFGDFELSIEWKVAGPGNSGIMFRVSEDADKTFKTGPEYQILNNAVHPNGKNPKTSAGANYALHAPTRDMTKPVGEWNHTVIKAVGPRVEHWLNGEKVVEYELWSDQWEQLVAESKFAQWPTYGRNKAGHICLQDHQDPVWFRNIKIRPL